MSVSVLAHACIFGAQVVWSSVAHDQEKESTSYQTNQFVSSLLSVHYVIHARCFLCISYMFDAETGP